MGGAILLGIGDLIGGGAGLLAGGEKELFAGDREGIAPIPIPIGGPIPMPIPMGPPPPPEGPFLADLRSGALLSFVTVFFNFLPL
jgi:hypothetical protein